MIDTNPSILLKHTCLNVTDINFSTASFHCFNGELHNEDNTLIKQYLSALAYGLNDKKQALLLLG